VAPQSEQVRATVPLRTARASTLGQAPDRSGPAPAGIDSFRFHGSTDATRRRESSAADRSDRLLASYGDDFTGSTDALARAGVEPVLYLSPPDEANLAAGAFDGVHDACLLQNHGVVAGGTDGAAALETAEKGEYAARIHR